MYWETGVLPDIDLAHDSLFLILDQEALYSSQSPSTGAAAPESGGDGNTQKSTKPPKSMSYGQAAWWKEMWIHTMQIPTLCIVTSRH